MPRSWSRLRPKIPTPSSTSSKSWTVWLPRHDPRVQHLVDIDHGNRQADEAPRPRHRHALHESGARHETRRGNTWTRDVERHRKKNHGNRTRAGKDAGRSE